MAVSIYDLSEEVRHLFSPTKVIYNGVASIGYQARYRGLAKTFLQQVLTAIAVNVIRINLAQRRSSDLSC